MVRHSSAQATALPRPGWRSPPLPEMAKREAPLEPDQPAPLAEANLEKPLAMLQENPLAGLVMRPDLPLPRLREMPKRAVPSDSELLTDLALAKQKALLAIRRLPEENLLAEAKRQTVPARLQENRPVEAMQLLWELVHLGAANRPLPEDLDLRRMEQRSVWVRLPAARARPQDLPLRRAERFALPPAHARRCSKDPGPCAFSQEILVARKCNRAARCGGPPISAQYRRPRNRRALAGCDNRCSRSRRKHAGPARPCLIAVEDKRRCRPPPFADSSVRFANSE